MLTESLTFDLYDINTSQPRVKWTPDVPDQVLQILDKHDKLCTRLITVGQRWQVSQDKQQEYKTHSLEEHDSRKHQYYWCVAFQWKIPQESVRILWGEQSVRLEGASDDSDSSEWERESSDAEESVAPTGTLGAVSNNTDGSNQIAPSNYSQFMLAYAKQLEALQTGVAGPQQDVDPLKNGANIDKLSLTDDPTNAPSSSIDGRPASTTQYPQ